MNNIIVIETTQNVDNSIRLSDIGKKFISQTFPLARSFNQARDIHGFNDCRYHILRLHQFDELI